MKESNTNKCKHLITMEDNTTHHRLKNRLINNYLRRKRPGNSAETVYNNIKPKEVSLLK